MAVLSQATIYQAEGNEQQAYLLLVRQAECAPLETLFTFFSFFFEFASLC